MSESGGDSRGKTLNFNVGVLGHVDSGKTSLARSLSSTASTAAFDKNPQSRERGITLDLGFSSFTVDLPDQLRASGGQQQYDSLQFTLVDCPGHASLIRTIIGGERCELSASLFDATCHCDDSRLKGRELIVGTHREGGLITIPLDDDTGGGQVRLIYKPV